MPRTLRERAAAAGRLLAYGRPLDLGALTANKVIERGRGLKFAPPSTTVNERPELDARRRAVRDHERARGLTLA